MNLKKIDDDFDSNRVLLTGASGFIGRYLLAALVDSGYRVTTVGRRKDGFLPDIEVADVFALSKQEWLAIVSGYDVVVHLAWYVEHNDYQDSKQNIECIRGTKNLINAVAESNVNYFLATGTCLEYEPTDHPIDVRLPLAGDTEYGRAKVEVFRYLSERFNSEHKKFGWARIFFIYGEDEPTGKLYSYATRQLLTGESISIDQPNLHLDFIPVQSAVQYLLNMIQQQYDGAINVCSGNCQSVKDFVLSLPQAQGKKVVFDINKKNATKQPKYICGIPPNFLGKHS